MNKWTGFAATAGGLLGAVAVSALKANDVDVVTHWMEIAGGVGGVIAALAAAFLAAVKAKQKAP